MESEKTCASTFISSLGQIVFVEPIIISSDAFNWLSDSVQSAPENSSSPVDLFTPVILENIPYGEVEDSSNSSLFEGVLVQEDMPLPLAMIPQEKLFPPIQKPNHPEIFILRDNLNASSENPIKLFSTEEPLIPLKVLSAMNTARDESQNEYNIKETLMVGPENMKSKPTDYSLSDQASISLKQTFTPLEIMSRSSAAGLDFRVIST